MSDDSGSTNSSENLKNKILSSISTTFNGEATNRWISAMNDDAFDAIDESVATGAEGQKLNQSMAAVIDRLFDNFKRYSFEFNRTQESREFEISCERPASMRASADYMDLGKPIKYCLGHLASHDFALIVQGEENRILVYITPVEYLIGFKPSPDEFPPHVEMRLGRDGKTPRDFVWSIGDQMLSLESIPVLARRLFAQLVKVTRGEAMFGEPFSLSPQEEKLAMTLPANAQIDRSFEDDQSMFLGQKKPDLSARTFVVATEPSRPEPLNTEVSSRAVASSLPSSGERPPLNALLNPSPVATSFIASSSHPQIAATIANGEPKALDPPAPQAKTPPDHAKTPLEQAPQSASEEAIAVLIFPEPAAATDLQMPAERPTAPHPSSSPWIGPPGEPVRAHVPSKSPLEITIQTHGEKMEGVKNNVLSGLDKKTVEARANIAQSLKALFDTVDGAINGLTAVGLEAMHGDDLDAVSAVMKQTKALKSLRDSVVTLSKDWQKAIEEK